MEQPLSELAKVIRSKNAGPFEWTLDVLFKDQETFAQACKAEVFTPERIAALYSIPESDVLKIIPFSPANAIKITLKRWQSSGGPGEKDVYGAQQHAPLLDMQIDL